MKYPISIILFLLLATGYCLTAQSTVSEIPKEASSEEAKYVLMVFSGSDWCKPCMLLKRNILSNQEFTNYSANRLSMQEVDFPYKKKNKLPKVQQVRNDALAAQYNEEGAFPKILLFNEDEEVLGEIKFEQHMTVDDFIYQINSKIEKQR